MLDNAESSENDSLSMEFLSEFISAQLLNVDDIQVCVRTEQMFRNFYSFVIYEYWVVYYSCLLLNKKGNVKPKNGTVPQSR